MSAQLETSQPDPAVRTRSTGTAPTARRPRRRRPLSRIAGDIALTIGIVLIVLPFAYTLVTTLRPREDVIADPMGWPSRLTFANVAEAFTKMDYGRGLINSLVIVLCSSILTIVLGSLAAYPLARITRGWTAWTYRLFIAGSTVPVFVLIAPLYLLMRDLNLLDTYFGVILAYAAISLPVAIFFYTSFLRQVPVELEEAAAIDGAGPVRVFFVVLFPLLQPITATLATFLTLSVWNDLVIPLVFLPSPGKHTVMVNAYALIGSYTLDPTLLFPAALLGVAPLVLLFLLLQRQVVDGMTMGAVKG